MRIGVIHGPNLNLLGRRERHLYGSETLEEINARLSTRGSTLAVALETFQSNHEGELVDHVQAHAVEMDGWLVNAGGLTHTSVTLRDALVATGRPFVEVHLTNIFAREPFRRQSLLSDVALGVVTGFGARSYLFGLDGLVEALQQDE
ncbi:MAG: type II 3-dehydroquinate dehydratase [Gemmatimonadota bacterium]|jgi:3-dehydroquinate dehydratase-2